MVMMSEAFPGKFLKAADLKGKEVELNIREVKLEDVSGEGEVKPVLYFVNKERGLVLNKTNASVLSNRYGDDSDLWTDKSVVLYPTTTSFQGNMVPCLRVKMVAPPAEMADAADVPF